MGGFNDWIFFASTPMSALDHSEEVDSRARENLARDMQTRLRGRIDPGINAESAQRAQAIRVKPDGDSLVIDQEDQGEVLVARGETSSPQDGEKQPSVAGVEQLFELSSGVPEAIEGADGKIKLAYRTITLDALFGGMQQGEQDRLVEMTAGESLRSNIVESYEEAVNEVGRRHPVTT